LQTYVRGLLTNGFYNVSRVHSTKENKNPLGFIAAEA